MLQENWTEKHIAQKINSMSGKYNPSEIFFDWVKCMAYSIANAIEVNSYIWEKREKSYKEIMKKYELNERREFVKMSEMLTCIMDKEIKDVLGNIYMNSEIYNKNLGQFFTPYHLCSMMAQMQVIPEMKENEYIRVNEPSCGAGANVIAIAENMKKNNINYQEHMLAICQDIDWNVVYMCYVQMALYGIPALVVQGNTLMNPYNGEYGENVFVTPLYILNKRKMKKIANLDREGKKVMETFEGDSGQMELRMEG